MHPELGFEEYRTAGIVAAELEKLHYQVQTGVATTGVVGLMDTGRPGLVVLLRFDMDCLPVQEENEVPYKSTIPGRMHACGHDGHVAIGLGVATLLAERKDQLNGIIKLMFQPAEEGTNGADAMVREGVLEDPRPDVALAVHLWNNLPVGRLIITDGPMMASAESWRCTIQGVGGHGAIPQQAVDPIVAAAQLISALQTIISRNVDPQQTAVFSVCTLHAGDAFNIIPESVTLGGTIRTFEPAVRAKILQRFEEIATGVCGALGCEATIEMSPLTPALVNDPAVTAVVREVAGDLIGPENLSSERTMGSEDFAFVNAKVPGCYFFVGSRNEAAGLVYGHHNPRFDFDEEALPLAVGLLVSSAMRFLG